MEESLAFSEPTTISGTWVEPLGSDLTPEQASLNKGEARKGPHPDEVKKSPPHPMLLSPVLECMFTHFINDESSMAQNILKDVRNFRLVCKIWRNEVTRLYRCLQSATVFDKKRGYSLSGMRTFLEVMKNSDVIPVESYRFLNDFFSQDTNQQLLKDFLLTCGSDIVSLFLDFYGHRTRGFDPTGLANLKLKKLKKLEFHYSMMDFNLNEDWDSQTHGLVLLLGVLLDSAKALEEFKIYYLFVQGQNPNIPNQASVKQQLEGRICQGLPKTVKSLNLPNTLWNETSYKTLTEKGLKLEEFHLVVCSQTGFPENELTIRKFLEKHANTMKTLRVTGGIAGKSSKFPFPRLNELRCLEMNRMRVNVFSFTQSFPKLQRLDVDRWDLTGQLAKTISKHFPNITELHISPDSDYVDVMSTLQEAFVHFPNIEQLYICMSLPCDLTLDADTLFSGVCKADRRRIRRWESNVSKEKFRKEQKMPSILNLTKLKKLVVKHDPTKGRFHLTDFTAYFVFLQMSKLKELSLSMANISPKYIERLEKKLNLSWRQHHVRSTTALPTHEVRMETLLASHLRELLQQI